ncbi:MAG: glycine--tRNA ligase subunit beta [Terriglobia bacterium]|jgi:glycyl-tRNA synthetase beta chain
MTASASNPVTLPLLLEIGCEEIPARFLSQAQKDLGERLPAALVEARLLIRNEGTGQPVQTFSTPRRLVAHVPAVLARQPDKTEEVLGPPVKVAFDAEGKPTRAAESFAQKNAAEVKDLIRVTTPKGEYLALKKTTPGRPAVEVLSEILPGVITGISFPKSMYWEASKTRFVRPIRWIVALLGEGKSSRVIPFAVAGVKSGNQTYGHRTLGPGPVPVSGFQDYAEKLRDRGVEFDPEARRELLRRYIGAALGARSLATHLGAIADGIVRLRDSAGEPDLDKRLETARARLQALPEDSDEASGLRVIKDQELEDWVVNSTEWPRALLGGFEERFLRLPREILITVMRDHQKYFAVENKAGKLQPWFVASANTDAGLRDLVRSLPALPTGMFRSVSPDVQEKLLRMVRAGHERVLTARFSDAEFFWNADQKIPLRDRVPMLDGVTYQAKLGSYGDKVRRMEAITREICHTLEGQGKLTPADSAHALRAVQLCKCDLTTQMVQEFTELQGIVGGLYAKAQDEPPEVADAIYDHYLPQGAEGGCPQSLAGAVVSLADKIDSVVAGYSVGLEPTGSSDSFGVRRAGNGIVRVIAHFGLRLDLRGLVEFAFPLTGQELSRVMAASVSLFLSDRIRHYLESVEGLPRSIANAALTAGTRSVGLKRLLAHGVQHFPIDVVDLIARARALQEMLGSEDLQAVCVSAKRIWNILAKVDAGDLGGLWQFDTQRLNPGPEADLYKEYNRVNALVKELQVVSDYRASLQAIATLRPAVDLFFDKVLVMAEDRVLRANRIFLLEKLDRLLASIADLSQIESPNSISVDASTFKDQ